MPIPHITGTPINLECSVPFSPDFPDILIAESPDDGIVYFDATAHIEALKNESLSVDKFFYNFQYMHVSLVKTLELDPKKTVRVNRKNHILIDAVLAYLFISYVSPDFIAYTNARIAELFTYGVAFSDSFLASKVKEQLPDEVIQSLVENEHGTRPTPELC